MKLSILILGLFFICEAQFANSADLLSVLNIESSTNQESIENGWYKAIIIVRHVSGDVTKEAVKVKVEIGNVVEIDLGNGESYHSGYNNENYEYLEGRLSFDHFDNNNNAKTSVVIKDIEGERSLIIIIENYKTDRISE